MQNTTKVLPIEKIISILSYFTMGIVGVVWLIVAHFLKRKLRYFLLFNVVQSMLIAIILAILKLCLESIFYIFAKIPVLDVIAALINFIISVKLIRLSWLGLSFTMIEFFVFALILYVSIGIFLGKIFKIPFISTIVQRAVSQYQ